MSYDFDDGPTPDAPLVPVQVGMTEERFKDLQQFSEKVRNEGFGVAPTVLAECLSEIARLNKLVELDVAGSLSALNEIDNRVYFETKRELEAVQQQYEIDMERCMDGIAELEKDRDHWRDARKRCEEGAKELVRQRDALNQENTELKEQPRKEWQERCIKLEKNNAKLQDIVDLARDCFGYDGATVEQAIRDAHEAVLERRTLRTKVSDLEKEVKELKDAKENMYDELCALRGDD